MGLVKIETPVAGILAGDKFLSEAGNMIWRAMGNAVEKNDGSIVVRAQFADGGCEDRVWPNGDHVLEVERMT